MLPSSIPIMPPTSPKKIGTAKLRISIASTSCAAATASPPKTPRSIKNNVETGGQSVNPANSRPQTRYKIYTNTCVKHISFTTTKNFARNKSNGRTGTAIIKFQLCPICSSRHR